MKFNQDYLMILTTCKSVLELQDSAYTTYMSHVIAVTDVGEHGSLYTH